MKRAKRRLKSNKKRAQRLLEKQELKQRIRKIYETFEEQLCFNLTANLIVDLSLAKQSPSVPINSRKKLSLQERNYIYLWKSLGSGVREIARRLKRAPSTISRELKRNKPIELILGLCSYSRAKQAHDLALARRKRARRRVRLHNLIVQRFVFDKIQSGLSPEIVSRRLLLEHGIRISHEAIYLWIYEVETALKKYLPRKGKRYQRGGKKRSRTGRRKQTAKLSIEKRPSAANERLEFGHWEVDCIVSKQSNTCLMVLQERVSRYFFIVKLPNCTAEEATQAIIKLLDPFDRDWLKSLTCDNGSEFWNYSTVSLALEIPVYFCHPYCASERGGVENRNGMIRKFFPKKTNFDEVTDEEVEEVRLKLLNRPMRCLGYFTPEEIFTGTYRPMFDIAA